MSVITSHKCLNLREKLDIIRRRETGASVKDLTSMFGVGKTQVYNILKRRHELISYLESGAPLDTKRQRMTIVRNEEHNPQGLVCPTMDDDNVPPLQEYLHKSSASTSNLDSFCHSNESSVGTQHTEVEDLHSRGGFKASESELENEDVKMEVNRMAVCLKPEDCAVKVDPRSDIEGPQSVNSTNATISRLFQLRDDKEDVEDESESEVTLRNHFQSSERLENCSRCRNLKTKYETLLDSHERLAREKSRLLSSNRLLKSVIFDLLSNDLHK